LKTFEIVKKIAITAAVVVPAALALASGAQASPVDQPFSVSLGANYLTDSSTRSSTSDYGLHVGLGYTIPGVGITSGTPSIDFDYDYNSGHGDTANTYGLFLADRYTLSHAAGASFSPYIGAGIGAAYLDGTGNGPSFSATNFAGKVMLGANFNRAFVEVAYNITGEDHGFDFSTVNLSVGTHF